MAQFVLGDRDIIAGDISPRDNDSADPETSQGGMEADKRHYKKDSRYNSYAMYIYSCIIYLSFLQGIWKIYIHLPTTKTPQLIKTNLLKLKH